MADYKKPDYWQLKARKEGYPARSVYKLQEMDEKFGLIKITRSGAGGQGTRGIDCGARGMDCGARGMDCGAAFRALDLGAAPGSWSLYALRKMAGGGFLTAADLSPLSRQYDKGLFSGENFFFIQGDITEPAVREAILSRGPYSLIISDAAPATTGNHSIDSTRSLELAEAVLAYAESGLAKGGNLAIKVFQGGDTAELLKRIKALFNTAKSFKPQACRSESVETYYIGLGKLTPPF
ncbi:ribosomal RNA large subunit methyltransferase E [Spirochaetia bacterium]|nr:ribosomal RNA large subunit methyltransferase E [Spirochaetia bacterium]